MILKMDLEKIGVTARGTQHAARWSYGSITENTIEIQTVRPTEVCVKVESEKNEYKSVKTSLLLSNVIDANHQKQLFVYK